MNQDYLVIISLTEKLHLVISYIKIQTDSRDSSFLAYLENICDICKINLDFPSVSFHSQIHPSLRLSCSNIQPGSSLEFRASSSRNFLVIPSKFTYSILPANLPWQHTDRKKTKQAGRQIGLSKQENRSTHWILPGGSTRESRHTLIPWMTQPVTQDVVTRQCRGEAKAYDCWRLST